MPLLRILAVVPRFLLLLVVGSLLYLIALVLAAFGHRNVLDQMRPTLVRWHFLAPRTFEERWNKAVSEVNLSAMVLGMSKIETAIFILRRSMFGRKQMTQFLEEKTKALTTHLPNVIANLATNDDLAMVVSASALLDEFLGLIIVTRFHVMITEKNWVRAFKGEGPLARFASKISMGIVLGLVIGDMINDLAYIKRIRNDFAHAIGRQSLAAEPHAKHCRKLKMSIGLADDVKAKCSSVEAQRYLESVSANIVYLAVVLNRAITERAFAIEHMSEINARAKLSADVVRAKGTGSVVAAPPT